MKLYAGITTTEWAEIIICFCTIITDWVEIICKHNNMSCICTYQAFDLFHLKDSCLGMKRKSFTLEMIQLTISFYLRDSCRLSWRYLLWVYHSAGSSIISNRMANVTGFHECQVTWRSPSKEDCMNLMDIYLGDLRSVKVESNSTMIPQPVQDICAFNS